MTANRAESPIVNAMSVDVEDFFQVSAFERVIDRDDWDQIECRVESNTDRVLALFERHRVTATFFTLGWVAERYPSLIKRIADQGHEIGSHGYSHVRATEQSPTDFAADIRTTRKILQDLSGQPVYGYRAASFSVAKRNLWALQEIEAAGYRYSSSVNPIRHDLYGIPDAPRFSFRPKGLELIEVPITTVKMFQANLPCGGGGYFRIAPYRYFKWAIRRVNERERQAAVFYFHPWEIDPAQPRQQGISLKTRFRHYTNLHVMEQRLGRLLQDFHWGRLDEVFMRPGSVEDVDIGLPGPSQSGMGIGVGEQPSAY